MAAAGCGRFGRRTSTPARAAARAAAGTAEAAAARTTTSCGCGSGRAQQRAVAFDCGRCSPWGDAESNARWLLIAGQGRDKLHPPRCREALSAYHRLAPPGRAAPPPPAVAPPHRPAARRHCPRPRPVRAPPPPAPPTHARRYPSPLRSVGQLVSSSKVGRQEACACSAGGGFPTLACLTNFSRTYCLLPALLFVRLRAVVSPYSSFS